MKKILKLLSLHLVNNLLSLAFVFIATAKYDCLWFWHEPERPENFKPLSKSTVLEDLRKLER